MKCLRVKPVREVPPYLARQVVTERAKPKLGLIPGLINGVKHGLFAEEGRIRRKRSWSSPLFVMAGSKVLAIRQVRLLPRKSLSWETWICNLTAVPLNRIFLTGWKRKCSGWAGIVFLFLPMNSTENIDRRPPECKRQFPAFYRSMLRENFIPFSDHYPIEEKR